MLIGSRFGRDAFWLIVRIRSQMRVILARKGSLGSVWVSTAQ